MKRAQMPSPRSGELNPHKFLNGLSNIQSQSLPEKGKPPPQENPEVPSSSGIDSAKSRDKDANEGAWPSFAASFKC